MASLSAGFVSGACTTVLGHPLDTMKVHLQIRKYGENIKVPSLKNLYRGLYPPLLTAGILQATYFTIYESSKRRFREHFDSSSYQRDTLLAGGFSGILISLLTNPVSLVKIQLQTSTLTMFKCYSQIFKKSGLGGFYRGMSITMIMECTGRGAYLHCYEVMKRNINGSDDEKSFTLLSRMASASIAGCYSWFLVYPMDVIKSRMQSASGSESTATVSQVARSIWVEAGLKGMYRGILFTLARAVPVASISLPLYEGCRGAAARLLNLEGNDTSAQ